MAIQYYADQDVKGNITASGNGSFTGQVSAAGSGVSAFTTVSGKGYSIGSSRIVYYDGTTYLGNIDNQGSGSTVIRSAGNNTLVLDTSNNATFAGDLTVSGGDIVLGATGRIQGVDTVSASTDAANKAYVDAHDGGAGVYLPLAAGSGSPLTGSLYIPNYIYHNGDTGTYIGYPSVGRFTIATGSATRADFTNAGFSLGDYQTNVSANIILDEDNMGSNSATALVTQQSVKAYVDAHTSGIGGSGGTNSIPMFTPNGTTIGNSAMSQANIGTGTAKRITVAGARMTITGGGGDADGGTLNLTNPSARLGIGVPASINGGEPEAALDVGKNARVRGSLNVGATNEQYLFVSTTGDQPVGNVKMGYYGDGTDYALSGDNTTSCQYTTAFSNGGRLCEDERIMTFKLTRSQIASLASTQKTLIAADSNFNYIVKEAYMYQVNTSPGQAPSFNTGNIVIQYQSSTGGTSRIDDAFELSSTILNQTRGNRKVLFFKPVENAQVGSAFAVPRAAVVLKATGSASNVGSGTVDYYVRLRVKNIDFTDDIVNNAQLIVVA
jgi:hypothetical protein